MAIIRDDGERIDVKLDAGKSPFKAIDLATKGIQELGTLFKPNPLIGGIPTPNPENILFNPFSQIPETQLQETGETAGFLLGSRAGGKGAAAGLFAGGQLAQGEAQRRQLQRDIVPEKTDVFGSAARAAGAGVGVGLFRAAAQLGKIAPFMGKKGSEAFGKGIAAIEKKFPGTTAELSGIRVTLIKALADRTGPIANAINQIRFDYSNKFGIDPIGKLISSEAGKLTISDAQHLSNALSSQRATKSMQFAIKKQMAAAFPGKAGAKELLRKFGTAKEVDKRIATAKKRAGLIASAGIGYWVIRDLLRTAFKSLSGQ